MNAPEVAPGPTLLENLRMLPEKWRRRVVEPKYAYVCEECHEPIGDPWSRLEKRVEFRRVADNGRYRAKIVGLYCTECAEDEMGPKEGGPHLGTPLFLVGELGEETTTG